MKRYVEFNLAGKNTKLEFTILKLAGFERAINMSVLHLILGNRNALKESTVDLAAAGLAYGLEGEHTLAEAMDILQEHIDKGGNIIEVNQKITEALVASGIFSSGSSKKNQEQAQVQVEA